MIVHGMQQSSQSLETFSRISAKSHGSRRLPVWSTRDVNAWLWPGLLDLDGLGCRSRRQVVVLVIAHVGIDLVVGDLSLVSQ